jgi:hypothetical protein
MLSLGKHGRLSICVIKLRFCSWAIFHVVGANPKMKSM